MTQTMPFAALNATAIRSEISEEKWHQLRTLAKDAQREASYQLNRDTTLRTPGLPRPSLYRDVTTLSQFLLLDRREVTPQWIEKVTAAAAPYIEAVQPMDEATENYEPDPDDERDAALDLAAAEDAARAGAV